jgi:hypothetical protein
MTTTSNTEQGKPRRRSLWPTWTLLAAYATLLLLDHFMILPGSYAIIAIAAMLLSLSFVVAVARNGEMKSSPDGTFLFAIMIALIGTGPALVTTLNRGDRQIEQEDYRTIAKEIRERPELRRFVIKPGSDGKIDNAEKSQFHRDVAAYDKARALGR